LKVLSQTPYIRKKQKKSPKAKKKSNARQATGKTVKKIPIEEKGGKG